MADRTFDDWRKEQLAKAPSGGGRQTSLAAYGPGSGNMGRINTKDVSEGGNIGLPAPGTIGPSPASIYSDARPLQPPNWIDDVDMGGNFFSPFQPVWPFGPPNVSVPREWDYPVGYNLNFIQPRMELMSMLRGMRASWGVLATIIATRQDQLLRIPWTIQQRGRPKAESAGVEQMKKFFRRPDGKLRYSQWARKLLDDLLVLDAPTIYFARDRARRPLYAEVLDGATVFPLIDDAGRRPTSVVEVSEDGIQYLRRQPAFQQIIKGLPLVDLDESEIMYVPMRPRPDNPMFGYPATEQILIEASEAIRKTFYQLDFWAEGTIPDLIVTVPKEWSPRQIAMFQGHFDAMLSGNLKLKSKVRFLPGDMKPFDVKNSSGEALWSQRDETLIRLACYAYSVSPTPFVKQLNRSVAQNAQQTASEEGLYPLMSYWKDDIMDPIIQEQFGLDDVEFVFLPRPEPDSEKQAKIHQIQVREGIRSRNEVRAELGEEPIPGGEAILIELGNAIIPLQAAAQGKALPMGPGSPNGSSSKPSGSHTNSDGNSHAPGENVPQRGGAKPTTGPAEIAKLWIEKATRDQLDAAARQAKGHLDDLSHYQLNAGNYPKGHIWIQGLDISIENQKGSLRGAKDQHGKKWEVRMPTPYGYIRGTLGADGDQVDVYLGTRPESTTVWVIDQNKVSKKKGKVKGFDEHKVMLGFKSLRSALKVYLKSHIDRHGRERLGDVTELSTKELKTWLAEGDTKEPLEGQGYGHTILRAGDIKKTSCMATPNRPLASAELRKSDTISAATNLSTYSQLSTQRKRKSKRRAGPRWLELGARV